MSAFGSQQESQPDTALTKESIVDIATTALLELREGDSNRITNTLEGEIPEGARNELINDDERISEMLASKLGHESFKDYMDKFLLKPIEKSKKRIAESLDDTFESSKKPKTKTENVSKFLNINEPPSVTTTDILKKTTSVIYDYINTFFKNPNTDTENNKNITIGHLSMFLDFLYKNKQTEINKIFTADTTAQNTTAQDIKNTIQRLIQNLIDGIIDVPNNRENAELIVLTNRIFHQHHENFGTSAATMSQQSELSGVSNMSASRETSEPVVKARLTILVYVSLFQKAANDQDLIQNTKTDLNYNDDDDDDDDKVSETITKIKNGEFFDLDTMYYNAAGVHPDIVQGNVENQNLDLTQIENDTQNMAILKAATVNSIFLTNGDPVLPSDGYYGGKKQKTKKTKKTKKNNKKNKRNTKKRRKTRRTKKRLR